MVEEKQSGVMCDIKVSAILKGMEYKMVVRPVMLYVVESVELRKRQEAELKVAEVKMLRFSLRVMSIDGIRNERGRTC